jgi:hypothetical protein
MKCLFLILLLSQISYSSENLKKLSSKEKDCKTLLENANQTLYINCAINTKLDEKWTDCSKRSSTLIWKDYFTKGCNNFPMVQNEKECHNLVENANHDLFKECGLVQEITEHKKWADCEKKNTGAIWDIYSEKSCDKIQVIQKEKECHSILTMAHIKDFQYCGWNEVPTGHWDDLNKPGLKKESSKRDLCSKAVTGDLWKEFDNKGCRTIPSLKGEAIGSLFWSSDY